MRDARERSSVALLGRKALAGDGAEAAAASAAAAGDAANRILEVALPTQRLDPQDPAECSGLNSSSSSIAVHGEVPLAQACAPVWAWSGRRRC